MDSLLSGLAKTCWLSELLIAGDMRAMRDSRCPQGQAAYHTTAHRETPYSLATPAVPADARRSAPTPKTILVGGSPNRQNTGLYA
jgi:hypothetical protein